MSRLLDMNDWLTAIEEARNAAQKKEKPSKWRSR
jgi:hypothetical protein